MNIKEEFREFLNEGRVKKATAYGKELAKKLSTVLFIVKAFHGKKTS